MAQWIIDAKPCGLAFDMVSRAPAVIDSQRDLVEPGGIFGWMSDARRMLGALGA